ncbi:MAG: helix-turn-helix domain-containing protein [Clostridium sp.]|nr:helix-turn-helix domain-containing protein [Clostridium sp.]
MAKKTIASLEEEIRVLNRQLDKISKANTRLINENEELKAEIIEYKDKISNTQLENNLLKGLNETLKLNKDIDKNISQNNNATIKMLEAENEKLKKENEELKNNNEELQEKLNRAIQRNKAIISDYAKCSKMNEQLKKQLQEVKQVGRPKRIDDNTVQKVIELRKENKSIRAIAKELNLSVGSVHNIIEQNKK